MSLLTIGIPTSHPNMSVWISPQPSSNFNNNNNNNNNNSSNNKRIFNVLSSSSLSSTNDVTPLISKKKSTIPSNTMAPLLPLSKSIITERVPCMPNKHAWFRESRVALPEKPLKSNHLRQEGTISNSRSKILVSNITYKTSYFILQALRWSVMILSGCLAGNFVSMLLPFFFIMFLVIGFSIFFISMFKPFTL